MNPLQSVAAKIEEAVADDRGNSEAKQGEEERREEQKKKKGTGNA